MEPQDFATRHAGLIARAKAMIMSPKAEWPVVEAEHSSIAGIYKSYVIPLAAIGPVCRLIGALAFGHSFFGITYRPSVMGALTTAVLSYVMTLVGVYVLALIVDFLAPHFGSVSNRTQAFKLAAYSSTAAWIVGVFGLLPALLFLGILGLYSFYVFYIGLPVLMKTPEDKAPLYTGAVVIVTLVAYVILGAVLAPLTMMFAGAPLVAGADSGGTVSGTLAVPGVGAVDMGKMNDAAKQLAAAGDAAKNGTIKVVEPARLSALLPATLNGLPRTSIESGGAAAAGVGGSNAEARYGSGEQAISLRLTDMGAMGGLAALGGALNVESSKQDGTRTEKIGNVDGRMTTEKFDSASREGSYGTIVANRINVEAEGHADSLDTLKAAVASVNLGSVEALVK
jgi:hypothetical protein